MKQKAAPQQEKHESDQQAEEFKLHQRMSEIGLKILVLSGKGGVGKSTVAANLARALAKAGKQVGLVDVDIHGPSIPKLMGLDEEHVQAEGKQMLPVKVDEHLVVMSIGMILNSKSEPVVWRGPMKYACIRQFLKDVVWGRLDYLIIDAPPGTGDEPLSVAQLVGESAGAIIVTTPQDVAIADVRRCVSFCKELPLPVIGMVENMSGLVCPKCGEKIDLFKKGGGQALAAEMKIPYLGSIPIDPKVVTAGDEGISFMTGETPAVQAFANVIERIATFSK